jgi:hypothetical protein
MANIIYNANFRISGPWLIEYKDLVELDKIIDEQWDKWLKINEDKVQKKVDEEIKLSPNTNRATLESRIREWYDYQYSRELIIKFKNEDSLVFKNFEEAAKEPAIKKEIVKEFQWKLSINRFNVDISLNKYSEQLNVSITPEDHEFTKDFLFMISGWIADNKPKKYLQVIKSWKGIQWYALVTYTGYIIASVNNNEYKHILNSRAAELLKDGINSDEINEAIQILLAKNSEYIPEKYINGQPIFVDNRFIIFIILLLISILLSFIPKNNIGIGKGVEIVKRWKNWLKILFFTIPGSILLPVIIDKIISKI